jgi:hypothetical protein
MFKPLDPLLHSELRLAVMSILISVEEADFPYLRGQTGATAGNLSVQIDKLEKANYIAVEKTFRGKRPATICRMTDTDERPSKTTWMPCAAISNKPAATAVPRGGKGLGTVHEQCFGTTKHPSTSRASTRSTIDSTRSTI